MSQRFSPLERRILLALVSLIRDREPDREEWICVCIPLRELYDRLYVPGDRSYELERRNQRQAQRRALGRLLKQGWVGALALAWAEVSGGDLIRWQGGGRRAQDPDFRWGLETPRWRLVYLTSEGVAAALALDDMDGGVAAA